MTSSFLYHVAVSIISRQVILRSLFDASPITDSLGFMNYYMGLENQSIVVLGSKNALAEFPSVLSKNGNKINLIAPSADFWLSEDGSGFVRGDICFYSPHMPEFTGFLASYESRVIWNYSSVLNPAIEKWSKESHSNQDQRFIVVHTNRLAGFDYFMIKATPSGLIAFWNFLKNGMQFRAWDEDNAPIEAAIEDSKVHWGKKWFMRDDIFAQSLAAINLFAEDK